MVLILNPTDPSLIDHNSLLNLAVGDVHTQYALLAGRAGGQTLIGGTAASNNLTLQGTSHATPGNIVALDNILAPTTIASLPAYSFSVDTNTGMWHPGSNQIGFAVGGINAINISVSAVEANLNLIATQNLEVDINSSLLGYARVGTATNATATGDFSAGLSGLNHVMFFDQSTGFLDLIKTATLIRFDTSGLQIKMMTSLGATLNLISGVASTPTVFNEDALDIDFRAESRSRTHMFFLDAGSNVIGINQSAPVALLHLTAAAVGSEVFRMESTATNDDPLDQFFHGRVATTDATVTTINTIAITASRTYLIEAVVRARRTGGTLGTADDGAGYVIRGTYKTAAGVVTLIGALSLDYTAEDQILWDASLVISGTNVLVRVTGAANNNITWHSTVQVSFIGT